MVVVVDRGVDQAVVPPSDKQVARDPSARDALELEEVVVESRPVDVGIRGVVAHRGVKHLGVESAGHLGDVGRVDRAWKRGEAVVEDELRRKRQVAVVVVARSCLRVDLEDLAAVRGGVGIAHRLPVVCENLLTRPRAVPDAHFVDISLEVLLHVVERLHVHAELVDEVRIERVQVLRLRPCADEERARRGPVLVCGERGGVARILHYLHDAVRRG